MTPTFFDCHLHTALSPDGSGTVAGYAAAAAAAGFAEIGISDHWELESDWRFDVAAARRAVNAACRPGIRLGAEVGYVPGCESQVRALRRQVDYLLGSVHDGPGMESLWAAGLGRNDGARRFGVGCYYQAVRDCINSGLFEVVGHIGFYRRYGDHPSTWSPELVAWERQQMDETARVAAAAGIIVEVNTREFAGLGETHATRYFLSRHRAHGGIRVCISSDAHATDEFGRHHAAAADLLRDLGYTHLTPPWVTSRGYPL